MLDKNLKTEKYSIIRQLFINRRAPCTCFYFTLNRVMNFKRNLHVKADVSPWILSGLLSSFFDNLLMSLMMKTEWQ